MRIAISGASGYIGQHLSSFLEGKGYDVIPLGRDLFKEDCFDELCRCVESCEVVINLAGASINKRWTEAYKQELYDSRIYVTRQLVHAINTRRVKPELFISASAVGYYPAFGEYDEYHDYRGMDFLARLCGAWEEEASACSSDVRLVITRFGVVLSEDGGALKEMLRLQRFSRVSVVIGNGQQRFPWISLFDLCRSFGYIIRNRQMRGVVNLVSPDLITQKQLAHTLARADKIRRIIPLPEFFFRLKFGEGASFVTKGQTVHPSKLQESGFTYIYPTIEKLMNITDHHTVPELDVKRYMGRWYEIARYENHFERGMTDVTATYTLLPDGKIRVENEGYKGGVHKKATGRAKQPDPKNNPGKLKVAFFLWFYADYYILELDADYQYAVIGSSTDKYLWILSRERNLPEAVREDLLGKITERGYDISKLIS